ncbi:MAG: hypothetical protein U0Z17_07295 [Bacteroidales bacterium]
MKTPLIILLLFAAITVSAQEKHLKNIKQLTFGAIMPKPISFDGKT